MERNLVLSIALEELLALQEKIQNREAYFTSCGYDGFHGHEIRRIRGLVGCSANCQVCPLKSVVIDEIELCSLRVDLFYKVHLCLKSGFYTEAEKLIQPFIDDLEAQFPEEQVQQQEKKSAVGCVPMKTLFQTALLLGGIIATIAILAV